MTAPAMRKQLMAYLETADDSKIRGLYSLWKDTLSDKDATGLTDAQLSFLNAEHRKHINGESKSYTWDEVRNRIRNKKAS